MQTHTYTHLNKYFFFPKIHLVLLQSVIIKFFPSSLCLSLHFWFPSFLHFFPFPLSFIYMPKKFTQLSVYLTMHF